eukprot:1694746-Rhodomonas_salina.2
MTVRHCATNLRRGEPSTNTLMLVHCITANTREHAGSCRVPAAAACRGSAGFGSGLAGEAEEAARRSEGTSSWQTQAAIAGSTEGSEDREQPGSCDLLPQAVRACRAGCGRG